MSAAHAFARDVVQWQLLAVHRARGIVVETFAVRTVASLAAIKSSLKESCVRCVMNCAGARSTRGEVLRWLTDGAGARRRSCNA